MVSGYFSRYLSDRLPAVSSQDLSREMLALALPGHLRTGFFAYQETKNLKNTIELRHFVMETGWNSLYKVGEKNEHNNFRTS